MSVEWDVIRCQNKATVSDKALLDIKKEYELRCFTEPDLFKKLQVKLRGSFANWKNLTEPPLWLTCCEYRFEPIPKTVDHFLPAYVLLKKENDKWLGYTEHSFAMSWLESHAYVYVKDSKKHAMEELACFIQNNVKNAPEYINLNVRFNKYKNFINRMNISTIKKERLINNIQRNTVDKYINEHNPYHVFEVTDPNLPVTVNMEQWCAHRQTQECRKFDVRNIRLKRKVIE